MPCSSHFFQRLLIVLQEKVVGPLCGIGPYAHNLQGVGAGTQRGIYRFPVYVQYTGIHKLISVFEAMGAGYDMQVREMFLYGVYQLQYLCTVIECDNDQPGAVGPGRFEQIYPAAHRHSKL